MNISSIPISIEQKMILKMNLPLQDFNEADKDNTIKPIKIKLKQTLLNNRHN